MAKLEDGCLAFVHRDYKQIVSIWTRSFRDRERESLKVYRLGLMPLISSVKNRSAVLKNPVGLLSLLQ